MYQVNLWSTTSFKKDALYYLEIDTKLAKDIEIWLKSTQGHRFQFEHISYDKWALAFEDSTDSVLFALTWL